MKSLNEEEIRSMLVEVCGDGSAGDRGVDLIENGLLDSLAIIELFTRLEELGYDIHPTRVDRSRLRTAEGIASLLREYAKE
ncbi:MAG: D-alanine--poly(phosphoribitol) ligase subunit 2 [Clostridiales bacterium]|nr:D-alanine--poly(phosphoribitol) ligase subunit 2 [Clostridiales bacterium]